MRLFFLTILMFSSLANATSPFMIPQPMPSEGMWYEGWFVRVTDPENKISFATITTSAAEEGRKISSSASMPGYVALIFDDEGKTRSVEVFPEVTRAEHLIAPLGQPRFRWSAENIGSVSDRAVELHFPDGEMASLRFGKRKPWSANSSSWGPGGVSTYLPFIPLAWWVESLGTPVSYDLRLSNGKKISGNGYAHIEKNWGKVFPKSWMWVQATSPDGANHLALAGGLVGFGPIEMKAFMIGYKTPAMDLEIRPDQGLFVRYETQIDSCSGNFVLSARNLRDRIEVRASADPQTFAFVSIPTPQGYKSQQGKESFHARIEVSVFRDESLIEKKEFERAALEFGAGYMVCPAPLL